MRNGIRIDNVTVEIGKNKPKPQPFVYLKKSWIQNVVFIGRFIALYMWTGNRIGVACTPEQFETLSKELEGIG